MRRFILFLICIVTISGINLSAQLNDSKNQKTLDQKVKENHDSLMTGSETAFHKIDELLEQAKVENNKEAELRLLSNKTWYFIRKTDLKEALKEAQKLDAKAIKYNIVYWQAAAHGYKLEIYSLSGLHKQAVEEFKQTIKLLDKSDKTDDDINNAKAISHIKVASVYEGQKNFGTAKNMLIKADRYLAEIKDDEHRRRIRYMNFSNLGVVNVELNNLDSAEYFINQSFMLSDGKEDETSLNQFRNYAVMGQIQNKKNKPKEALDYLKHAEELEPRLAVSLLEKHALFEEIAKTYKLLDSTRQAMAYLNKAKDFEVELEKSKNSSLHKIIKDDLLKEKNYSLHIIVGASALLLISLFFIFKLYRKNKTMAMQEKNSQQYLKEIEQLPYKHEQSYKELLEMARNDDPAFLDAFHKVFPGFLERLLALDKSIAPTEIEFCALLRLNIPTKEMAQYKNIEPKSIQNKKYRIRKKLNIPDNEDIYYWFNKL